VTEAFFKAGVNSFILKKIKTYIEGAVSRRADRSLRQHQKSPKEHEQCKTVQLHIPLSESAIAMQKRGEVTAKLVS
jgi:hypothetical protein